MDQTDTQHNMAVAEARKALPLRPPERPMSSALGFMPLSRAVALAKLCLRFGRVERVTRHEDGVRPETDTDHTVMLAVVALDLCPEGLDRGLVGQFAIVHDLIEADCGDTQTLTLDDAGRAAKADRERVAREGIVHRFGPASWLAQTIEAYERQDTVEAQYVRVLDKVLPKLTHMLNRCAAAKELTTRAGFLASHREQLFKLRCDYTDPRLSPVFTLLAEAMEASEQHWS